jgi:DNA polymerase III delta subunit
LKPPVFFKEIGLFQNQVELWGVKKSERALEILIETDLKTKTLSTLGQSIVGDVVVRLANVARK